MDWEQTECLQWCPSWQETVHWWCIIPSRSSSAVPHTCILLLLYFYALLCTRYFCLWCRRIFASFCGKTTHFVDKGHAVGGHVVRFLVQWTYAVTRIWVQFLCPNNTGGQLLWRGRDLSVGSWVVVTYSCVWSIGNNTCLDGHTRLKRHHLLCCSCRLVHAERRRSFRWWRCRVIVVIIVRVLFWMLYSVLNRARSLHHKPPSAERVT